MDRRELLKSISLLSGAAIFLPKDLLANKRAKNLHLVGMGDGGCKMVQYLLNRNDQADFTLINSSFKGYYAPISKQVIYEIPNDAYTGRNINLTTLQSQECLPQNIKNVFADNSKHYVIIAGLGGFTGSYLSRAFISHLKSNNIAYNSIISLPFTHEGLIKRNNAEIIKSSFGKIQNTVFVDFDSIREKHGNFKLVDAFAIANEYVYKAYKQPNVFS